ncbi:hypothetical protein ABW21_db0206854 [Orbilia brochopaga]|nr:hypothetical protein ABW21_db0206854 [Drechslerella brochopaga]
MSSDLSIPRRASFTSDLHSVAETTLPLGRSRTTSLVSTASLRASQRTRTLPALQTQPGCEFEYHSRRIPNRLLNTATCKLKEANEILRELRENGEDTNANLLSYAILSHTWLDPSTEEVTYKDLIDNDLEMPTTRTLNKLKGIEKLANFCDIAQRDGYTWAWMDTCCIDKNSLPETQEAINAMFAWYRNSTVCYTYLSDVETTPGEQSPEIDRAKWFTRSWTVQELIAPSFIQFLDKNWRRIGTKTTRMKEIEAITGIGADDMLNYRDCSIAKKLSWAAHRKATKLEDQAYSLLGLFDISLPLIYGEGPRAFIRFQEELIRRFDDETIFAWTEGCDDARDQGSAFRYNTYLAPAIGCFQYSSRLVKTLVNTTVRFSLTNHGLELTGRKCWRPVDSSASLLRPGICLVELACREQLNKDELGKSLAIMVHHARQAGREDFKRTFGCTVAEYVQPVEQRQHRSDELIRGEWTNYRGYSIRGSKVGPDGSSTPYRTKGLTKTHWEECSAPENLNIVRSDHNFDRPRVLVVVSRINVNIGKAKFEIFTQSFKKPEDSGKYDVQYVPTDLVKKLESKALVAGLCCFSHGQQRKLDIKLRRKDDQQLIQFELTLTAPAPKFGAPDSPDYSFNFGDKASKNAQVDSQKYRYKISTELFPIPPRDDDNDLLAARFDIGELRKEPGIDFRIYRLTTELSISPLSPKANLGVSADSMSATMQPSGSQDKHGFETNPANKARASKPRGSAPAQPPLRSQNPHNKIAPTDGGQLQANISKEPRRPRSSNHGNSSRPRSTSNPQPYQNIPGQHATSQGQSSQANPPGQILPPPERQLPLQPPTSGNTTSRLNPPQGPSHQPSGPFPPRPKPTRPPTSGGVIHQAHVLRADDSKAGRQSRSQKDRKA